VRQDENRRAGIQGKGADKPGGGDVEMQESGMGVPDEAMGLISGGTGLREVGRSLEEDD
jgi:cyclin H